MVIYKCENSSFSQTVVYIQHWEYIASSLITCLIYVSLFTEKGIPVINRALTYTSYFRCTSKTNGAALRRSTSAHCILIFYQYISDLLFLGSPISLYFILRRLITLVIGRLYKRCLYFRENRIVIFLSGSLPKQEGNLSRELFFL